MMITPIKDDDELLLNAYCDVELDPVSAIEFERRLTADQVLQARYVRLLSLRRAVRALPRFDMPAGLEDRITSGLDAASPQAARPRRRGWSFQALAAAAVFGAVISGSVMLTMQRYGQREEVAREVVAGHIRGLLASQPFDVASSDRHTVKPWFTAHIPQSPQVPDLAAEGFVLVGGRVDVVGHEPVATIVYKHAKHTVSVTTLPAGQTVSGQTIAGYNVRSWGDSQFSYIAVSDIPSEDLATFEHAFSTAPSAPEVK